MKTLIVVLIFFASADVLLSQNYFQKAATGPVATDLSSSSMCAWTDYDMDNDLDLIVIPWNTDCAPCEFQIQIYENQGTGNFERKNNGLGLLDLYGNGISCGDYDNDGRQDVFITRGLQRTNLLFHNDGDGNFTRITQGEIVTNLQSSVACAWADYDKDGYLDIFVANAFSENDALYRNNGNGSFTKILTGPIVNDNAASQSCAWGDYDNDGWIDLFVSTYLGQKDLLYHNNGDGTFSKITSGPVVNDEQWGSGCAWADYNNDLKLDLLVSNTNGTMRLYRNEGNGSFTQAENIFDNIPENYYYPSWGDFDNDGWIDIFVPTWYQKNKLYKNNSGINFQKITTDIVTTELARSDAGIWGDFNSDGKLDLFVSNSFDMNKNFLYRNVTNNQNNYLTINLNIVPFYDVIIGAKIKIVKDNIRMIREVSSGNGSQNMLFQHFGLGNITQLDSVIIYWPSGSVWTWTNVNANNVLYIDHTGTGTQPQVIPGGFRLDQNYPNPFNPKTKLGFEIPESGFVTVEVFNSIGQSIATIVKENKSPGHYDVEFDGSNLPGGIYFYRLEMRNFKETKRMILIK